MRSERERARLTQKELARHAGLSRATVIAMESGARFDVTTLLAAAKALDLEIALTPRTSIRADDASPQSIGSYDPTILDDTEEL